MDPAKDGALSDLLLKQTTHTHAHTHTHPSGTEHKTHHLMQPAHRY